MAEYMELRVEKQLELLGSGAFGVVYRVECSDRSILAAKYLNCPLGSSSAQTFAHFRQDLEAELNLRRLRHRNVMRFEHVYYDQFENSIVILSELIDGEDIAKTLQKKSGGFSERKTMTVSKQILSGLQYLHHQQPPVIHRDLKGSNIMMTKGGTVKLIDFGLSLKLLLATGQSYRDAVHATYAQGCGTPLYMAPELFNSRPCYSTQSDIWAFGCIVLEMVTGQPPYYAASFRTLQDLVDTIVTSGAPELPLSASGDLRHFYSHCVAMEPSDRWSATQLLRSLQSRCCVL